MSRNLKDILKNGTRDGAKFFLGPHIYHRWFGEELPEKTPPQEVSIPRVDDGAPVPIIYGRCRVRAPILAWHAEPERVDGVGAPGSDWPVGTSSYHMDMFFVLGLGFAGTLGTNKILGMWAGEKAFSTWGTATQETELITQINMTDGVEPGYLGGFAFYYDGDAAQDLSEVVDYIVLNGGDADDVPFYRGMLSVLLYNSGGQQWLVGSSPSVPAYSFEASSYAPSSYPWGMQIGLDANPIDVLYDILVAQVGKLGINGNFIDVPSFVDAAGVLVGESHGYSRCIEDRREAKEIILEILKQIDAVLFFDETEVQFKIKLIRNDYDPETIPQLTKDNCDPEGTSFSSGGWSNLINKVKVVYTNRDDGYRDGSETARNQANAAGQDGVAIEHVVEFRGVTYASLAYALAHRELAHLSRPLMKAHVIVNREFVRVHPGDAIRVYWSSPDISGIVFRVASVSRGTLEDGRIRLDLIQDVNYSYRGLIPEPPSWGDTGLVGGGIVGGVG
jgi:hypothetical protein